MVLKLSRFAGGKAIKKRRGQEKTYLPGGSWGTTERDGKKTCRSAERRPSREGEICERGNGGERRKKEKEKRGVTSKIGIHLKKSTK